MPFKSPLPPVPLETQPYGERMLDVLWRHGAANPTKKAIICAENPEFSVTYHELYHHSLSVAAFLETEGFKKGDVLLTVMPNSWEIFEVTIGAALRGIIVTGVGMLYTAFETEKQICDSGASVIFCADDKLELVLKATANVNNIKKIVVVQLSDRTKNLPTNLAPGITRFDEVLTAKPSVLTKAAKIDVEKDFIYTRLNPTRDVASECILMDLPLCFIYGSAMLHKALVLGQTVVVMHHFEEHCYFRSIQNFKVHYLFLKPTVIITLANSPNVGKYDLSSVEGGLSSGSSASREVCFKALNRLPNFKRIDQGYGMTETSGACALPIIDGSRAVTDHLGVLSPNYEAKVVNMNGVEMPPGEPGELLLRSPSMMLGYIGRLEATANAFTDGWYRTGDLVRIDANGFMYLVGRLKEIIKAKGYPVPPAELEDVLLSHADIIDAGVIGIPCKDGDEVVFAFIVRKNNNISEKEIHEFMKDKVAEYKQLRGGIRFVDSIPKSDTGKILRTVLRNMYETDK